jgi:hypothetical protein
VGGLGAAVLQRAVTELGPIVLAPTLRRTIIEARARVIAFGGNVHCTSTGAEVHRRQIRAHLRRRSAARLRVPEAELTVKVVPPTLHRTVFETGTGMHVPRGQLHGSSARSKVHGRQVSPHLPWPTATFHEIAKAQLSAIAGPPTLDGAVVQAGTRVNGTTNDLQCGAAGAKVYRREVPPHFARPIAPVKSVSQTKLGFRVVAPALDLTVVESCTGVKRRHGELQRAATGT